MAIQERENQCQYHLALISSMIQRSMMTNDMGGKIQKKRRIRSNLVVSLMSMSLYSLCGSGMGDGLVVGVGGGKCGNVF